jgi:CRISPR-associated exonuclease Cas4
MEMEEASPSLVSVGDLKQYVYCPRIVYFTRVVPLRPPSTYLMERGRRLQEEFERLEPRRALGRYGLAEAERHFEVRLRDENLCLTGVADLVLEAAGEVAVVEFKATARELAENQKVQLGAYALLAEKQFRKPCPRGFVLLADRQELEEVEISPDLRSATLAAIEGVNRLFTEVVLPPPTPVRARCTLCEFRNFCGDVF